MAALSSGIEGEVFVVDNASQDGTIAYLRHHFPSEDYPFLHLIANTHNKGFGRANNQAAQRAKGEYVLYLNPDTILTEQTLSECISFADSKADFGGLGVKMLADDGRFALESRRGIPTPWRALCKILGITRLFPHSKIFGGYYHTYESKELPQKIEIISGAFMMVKNAPPLTLFDNDFFMYGEDIDLSYRLIKAHKQNYYFPSPIVHYKGESTHKSSYRYVHVFYQAIYIFYQKHFQSSLRFLNYPIKVLIIFQALCSLLKLNIRQFLRFLSPNSMYPKEHFIYLGENTQAIQQLATIHGLNIEILPKIHLSELNEMLCSPQQEQPLYLIFDVTNYTYTDILNTLSGNNRSYFLATFHPQIQTLITGDNVYTYQP